LGLNVDRGPRGLGGRKRAAAAAEPAAAVTGGLASIPAGTPPAVAVLLTAADLMTHGYTVFLPITPTANCDLVAIDRQDRVERVVVRRARRAGGEIRYDDPARGKYERRAMLLTDE